MPIHTADRGSTASVITRRAGGRGPGAGPRPRRVRPHAAVGLQGWAAYGVTTGVAFFAAFAAIATGSGARWATVAVGVAVVLGWGWLSATSVRLTRGGLK